MDPLGVLGPIVLRAVAWTLFLAGSLAFLAMLRGALSLRRLALNAPPDDTIALLKSRLAPSVSVIFAPADSSQAARRLARTLMDLQYPNFELVVALSAPSEPDVAAWRGDFDLERSQRPVEPALPMGQVRAVWEARMPARAVVLDLAASTRPQAWNAAVNAAECSYIAMFGDNCRFEPKSLLHLVRPLLEGTGVIAVSGVAPDAPGEGLRRGSETLWFAREWLIRVATLAGHNLIAPPAASGNVFAREAVLACGGFRAGLLELAFDIQAAYRRKKEGCRVAFVPGAGCYAKGAPAAHEAFLCASTAMAPLWLRVAICADRIVRPVLEGAACVLTMVMLAAGRLDWRLALLILSCAAGWAVLLSLGAVALPELAEPDLSDPKRLTRLFVAALAENFGLRQTRGFARSEALRKGGRAAGESPAAG